MMGSEIPMILPKGIVVNTENVYDEIASHKQVPFDRVWQVWRVYTITNRKLQDPTARRLENFWWHVMGSDRRLLSGELLAGLYEDISLGSTFIPLKGPSNRWDGDDPPVSAQQVISILESEKAKLQPGSGTSPIGKPPHSDVRGSSTSASAARPPPSHPILKKPRGPSTSGPRPTARFVSPHASGDEEDQEEGGTSSSGSTVTPALEMRGPHTSPPKKKTVAKKFVASKASGKRRPVLPRKTSSQSSVISDQGARINVPSPNMRGRERVEQNDESRRDAPLSTPTLEEEDGTSKMSSKAAGKRPVVPTIHSPTTTKDRSPEASTDSPGNSSLPTSRITLSSEERADRLFSGSPGWKPQRAQSSIDLSRQPLPSLDSRSPHTPRGPAAAPFTSVAMAQSRSYTGYQPANSNAARKGSAQSLFTGATSSTTNVAARGLIIDQSGGTFDSNSSSAPGFFDQIDAGARSESFSSSLLEPRLVPTPPSTSASVPLGRTRSQLTLLLEREKQARGGSNSRWKS